MKQAIGKRFLARDEGVSAIEFALIAPILTLILVAGLDLGLALLQRFELNSALNAATSYALVNRTRVGSAEGSALANELATLIAMEVRPNTSVAVDLNNGPQASVAGNVLTASGISSQANMCWCPKRDGADIDWGSSRSCGTPCSGLGQAGKFVSVTLSQPYESLLFDFGVAVDGTLKAASVARTE
jgi:Flp pilus assembly protein TadG